MRATKPHARDARADDTGRSFLFTVERDLEIARVRTATAGLQAILHPPDQLLGASEGGLESDRALALASDADDDEVVDLERLVLWRGQLRDRGLDEVHGDGGPSNLSERREESTLFLVDRIERVLCASGKSGL